MSQQSALRSNNSTTSNTPIGSHQATTKRVSFHDPNANTETTTRNMTGSTSNTSLTMDTIREDPNVSIIFFINALISKCVNFLNF